MDFQRRQSSAAFKPTNVAKGGNSFCGERLVKTGTCIPVSEFTGAEKLGCQISLVSAIERVENKQLRL